MIEITGLKEVLNDLKRLGVEGEDAIEIVTESTARKIASDARISVVKDTGASGISGSINPIELDKLNWKVKVGKHYGAYVEFGTGSLVEVPSELKDVAIKFKGKGIKEVNLPARPYLYPAWKKGISNYITDLKKELEALTKRI